MGRILEFAANNFILVSAFFILWTLFFMTESRRGGNPLSPQQATNKVNRENALVVDVRAEDEYRSGHIPGSINIPYVKLVDRIGELEANKGRPLIMVCNMGNHASAAGRQLKARGFDDLWRIRGGLHAWRADSLPVVKA